jgi:hypothetical protein
LIRTLELLSFNRAIHLAGVSLSIHGFLWETPDDQAEGKDSENKYKVRNLFVVVILLNYKWHQKYLFISVESKQKHITSKRNNLENAVIFIKKQMFYVVGEAGDNFFLELY